MTDLKQILAFLSLIILFQFHPQTVKAQSFKKLRSTASIGGTSQIFVTGERQYLIQQSIGQSGVIGPNKNNGLLLRQGFIQPIEGTNISSSLDELQVIVTPNPFSRYITISFAEKISDEIYIIIYTISGNTIHTQKYSTTQKINLNLSSLIPELYILRIYSDTKYYTTKLIKQ